MGQRLQFITAIVLGISAFLTLIVALGAFSLDLFFLVSFMMFVAVIELTAPDVIDIPWRRKLPWFTVAGLLLSTVLLGRRIVETLPDGGLLT